MRSAEIAVLAAARNRWGSAAFQVCPVCDPQPETCPGLPDAEQRMGNRFTGSNIARYVTAALDKKLFQRCLVYKREERWALGRLVQRSHWLLGRILL